MSTYSDDHKLLIHYFQDSLTGVALKWYMGLDGTWICNFNDLSEAFVRQYKYNVDMAPDWDQLRAMSQKDRESILELYDIFMKNTWTNLKPCYINLTLQA